MQNILSKMARARSRLLALAALVTMLAGCEQVENRIARWTGGNGYPTDITVAHLLVSGAKYDGLYMGVGGYIGPHIFGQSTSLFFVEDHIALGAAHLDVLMVGEDDRLQLENICDNIGTYVDVVGTYNHQLKRIDVERINWSKEPTQRMDRAACEELTAP